MKIFKGSTGSGKTTEMFNHAKMEFVGKKVGVISEGDASINGYIDGFDFEYAVLSSDIYTVHEVRKIIESLKKVEVVVLDTLFKKSVLIDLFELEKELNIEILTTVQSAYSERENGVSVIEIKELD